jgi:uracil-DNA glycosylase
MWFEAMHSSWQEWLAPQARSLSHLEESLANMPALAPRKELVMEAFRQDPSAVKVVIVGQDPYPTPGVAIGRAFAVSPETSPVPASLRNIFTELAADIGGGSPQQTLLGWQQQGVLLLNRHLTAIEGESAAHAGAGWEPFTEAAIRALIERTDGMVLVLWGNHAQTLLKTLGESLDGAPVKVITSAHPSPLSAYRGFFGSKPFSAINAALVGFGKSPINWNL